MQTLKCKEIMKETWYSQSKQEQTTTALKKLTYKLNPGFLNLRAPPSPQNTNVTCIACIKRRQHSIHVCVSCNCGRFCIQVQVVLNFCVNCKCVQVLHIRYALYVLPLLARVNEGQSIFSTTTRNKANRGHNCIRIESIHHTTHIYRGSFVANPAVFILPSTANRNMKGERQLRWQTGEHKISKWMEQGGKQCSVLHHDHIELRWTKVSVQRLYGFHSKHDNWLVCI